MRRPFSPSCDYYAKFISFSKRCIEEVDTAFLVISDKSGKMALILEERPMDSYSLRLFLFLLSPTYK